MTLCWLVGVWLLQPSPRLSQPRNLVVTTAWLFHGCYQVAACLKQPYDNQTCFGLEHGWNSYYGIAGPVFETIFFFFIIHSTMERAHYP